MKTALSALLLIVIALPQVAQGQANERKDDLLDHIAGNWLLEGTVMGAAAHHDVTAEWVLNHQFLRIHEKTALNAPASERHYEAIWFIGYDLVSERYVAHLLDLFGARFSETLGYGAHNGNAIRFVFEYPDGHHLHMVSASRFMAMAVGTER
jgi:hypothetical protein